MSILVREVRVVARFFRISDMEAMAIFFSRREQWAIEDLLFRG